MADRPILFSAPMVRALLEGRKTQTRRVLNRHNATVLGSSWAGKSAPWCGLRFDEATVRSVNSLTGVADIHLDVPFCHPDDEPEISSECGIYRVRPIVEPGDRLWVRETIGRRKASFLGIEATNGTEEAFYTADESDVLDAHEFNLCPWWKAARALPAIHMPRWASRLTLIVTDVRVQRLQEINEADLVAEGMFARDFLTTKADWQDRGFSSIERCRFHDLWDALNGPRGFGWEANPWVVALTFSVRHGNIDALEAA